MSILRVLHGYTEFLTARRTQCKFHAQDVRRPKGHNSTKKNNELKNSTLILDIPTTKPQKNI